MRKVPGSHGLPGIGRVLGTAEFFLCGWEGFFIRRRERLKSTVFKINLFQPTIAILDDLAISALFGDRDLVQDYGFSWAKPPPDLTGEHVPSIFAAGHDHDDPKAFVLDLIRSRAAVLPGLSTAILDRYEIEWERKGSFAWTEELETLAIDLVFTWLLGAAPDIAETRLLYNNIFLHPFPSIERMLGLRSYQRSRAAYSALVGFIEAAPDYGAIRSIAAVHGLDDDVLPHRLAFLLGMNSYLGTQSLLKSIVGELARHPEIRARVASVPATATVDPLVDAFLNEVLRLHPPVSFIFGRATKDRSLASRSGDFAIQRGDLLMGVMPFVQRDPRLFPEPERFDLARYDQPEATHRLIWPRGPADIAATTGDRMCPGKDPALAIARIFCTRIARYSWMLDEPPRWDHKRFSLNVAAPVGSLAVSDFHR